MRRAKAVPHRRDTTMTERAGLSRLLHPLDLDTGIT
jgi:hypothetical protein